MVENLPLIINLSIFTLLFLALFWSAVTARRSPGEYGYFGFALIGAHIMLLAGKFIIELVKFIALCIQENGFVYSAIGNLFLSMWAHLLISVPVLFVNAYLFSANPDYTMRFNDLIRLFVLSLEVAAIGFISTWQPIFSLI